MRSLAIETSGRAGSIAIAEDGVLLAEDVFPSGLRHAAELLPRIDRLCRTRGWGPGDLSELYVSAGPGSFTGLRIGVTLAKTLAFATGAKIVAVPSMQVLVRNAPAEAQHVIVVLDARRGHVFAARFTRDVTGNLIEAEPAHLDMLPDILARSPRPAHLLGEGIPYHKQSIPDDARLIITPEAIWQARVEHVVTIGYQMAQEGHFASPDQLTPIYLRKPEAEEKLDAQGS